MAFNWGVWPGSVEILPEPDGSDVVKPGVALSLPATAQLEFINQMPADAASRLRCPAGEATEPHPELAGCKVRITGTTPIFLIDRLGYRRFIPFPLTFLNLFKDAEVLQVVVSSSVAQISQGPPLDYGAVLIRGRGSEPIYVLDGGKKRLITCPGTMDKYGFNEESVVVVPQILVDAIPDGEIWE